MAQPNPFNPRTVISFKLPVERVVSLTVYDARGRIVRRLLTVRRLAVGRHEFTWSGVDQTGRAMPTGVYYGHLDALPQMTSVALTLIR